MLCFYVISSETVGLDSNFLVFLESGTVGLDSNFLAFLESGTVGLDSNFLVFLESGTVGLDSNLLAKRALCQSATPCMCCHVFSAVHLITCFFLCYRSR